MKNYFMLAFLCAFIFAGCDFNTHTRWDIEFTILNQKDSSLIGFTPKWKFDVSQNRIANIASSSDTFVDNKTILSELYAAHYTATNEQDLINENPKLSILVWSGKTILIDTTLSWQELSFNNGHSRLWDAENQMVSKKVFYLKVQ